MSNANRTSADIVGNCGHVVTNQQDIERLLQSNPAGGGYMSTDEFAEEERTFKGRGISRIIAFGPFSEGLEFNQGPLIEFQKRLSEIPLLTWDLLIKKGTDPEIHQLKKLIDTHRFQLDEIPWEKNSDTRLVYYLALNSLYTLIHLHNHSENYKDIAFVVFLAEEPFAGFKKTKQYRPDLSISAVEVQTILELRKRGYPLPPVYFVHGLLQDLQNYGGFNGQCGDGFVM